jgi:hypothetical protein
MTPFLGSLNICTCLGLRSPAGRYPGFQISGLSGLGKGPPVSHPGIRDGREGNIFYRVLGEAEYVYLPALVHSMIFLATLEFEW